jgi:hypothetical protein
MSLTRLILAWLVLEASAHAMPPPEQCRLDHHIYLCAFPPPPPLRPPVFSFAAGAGYRSLHGQHHAAGAIDIRIAGEPRGHVELSGQIIVESGAAELRLPVTQLRAGFGVRGILGRSRIGGGMRFGMSFLTRITNGAMIAGFVIAPFLSYSVDIVQRPTKAFFFGVDLGLDCMLWGAFEPTLTGLLGVRTW